MKQLKARLDLIVEAQEKLYAKCEKCLVQVHGVTLDSISISTIFGVLSGALVALLVWIFQ